jgi:hypothetical protein
LAFEDSLHGEPAYLHAEMGILFEQVARRAAERARIGAAGGCKFKGEVEEAGAFGGGKPSAWIAARLS